MNIIASTNCEQCLSLSCMWVCDVPHYYTKLMSVVDLDAPSLNSCALDSTHGYIYSTFQVG